MKNTFIVYSDGDWSNKVDYQKPGCPFDEDMHRIMTELPPGVYEVTKIDDIPEDYRP